MSEQSIVALVAVILSGLVGIASLGFNFWNSSREREFRLQAQKADNEERYRAGLYEKRLAVHQEAFHLGEALGGRVPAGALPEADGKDLRESVDVALDWLTANTLYLDPLSTGEFVRLLRLCLNRARGDVNADVDGQTTTTLDAITKGIGFKHIDVAEMLDNLEAIRRTLQ